MFTNYGRLEQQFNILDYKIPIFETNIGAIISELFILIFTME